MELILLYIARTSMYLLAGYIAYRKRMWWLLALTILAPILGAMATFYASETQFERALIANVNAFIIVMIALKSRKNGY